MMRLVVLNPLTNDHGRTFHLSFKHNIQQHLFFVFHPVNMEILFSFFFYPLHMMVLSSSYYPMHSIVLFSSPVHVMRWYFFFLSTGSSSCHKAKLLSKFCDCIGIFIEFWVPFLPVLQQRISSSLPPPFQVEPSDCGLEKIHFSSLVSNS